jgi:hypothetical protein
MASSARQRQELSGRAMVEHDGDQGALPRWLGALAVLLAASRLVYHWAYVTRDPFALVAFSDGQLYETAARDLVAHPPLGTQPFFLQGLYAYLLACGLALRGQLLDGLLLQLALCALTSWLFWRAARAAFGPVSGALCACALLASGALAFYENKYLSAALGVACNIAVISSFVSLQRNTTPLRAMLLGAASGLSVLARPNLLLAIPFTLLALHGLARERGLRVAALLAAFSVGLGLVVAPMAARNWLVTGTPSVFPSHGGGIPFYIGNNPTSTGLWNDANGLLSGQVVFEREELAERLQIDPARPDIDAAIGGELYARGLHFIAEQPWAWLTIEAKKLGYLLGNHEFVHDYDWLGERELLGGASPLALPFGLLLSMGAFGCWLLLAAGGPGARLALLLFGQLVAVLAANLLWFTSAQNRLPLVVPLAFAAGPGCRGLVDALRSVRAAGVSKLRTVRPLMPALIGCALLAAQAFVPRPAASRPSAVHYYNLANAEESLGRNAAALEHYARAAQRSPKQPMFWLRLAHLARRSGAHVQASAALDRLEALPAVPAAIRAAAASERRALPAAESRPIDAAD